MLLVEDAWIYALVDPDRGYVRYVGQSVRPHVRFREHLTRRRLADRMNDDHPPVAGAEATSDNWFAHTLKRDRTRALCNRQNATWHEGA